MESRTAPRSSVQDAGLDGVLPPLRVHRRTADELLRDAWAIRRLLDDLEPHEHSTRIRLLLARDQLRLEAAQQWHEHGWRPITDDR